MWDEIKRLPWWIKIAVVWGLAFMSAFAGVLSVQFQLLGFIGGIALFALGLVASVDHLIRNHLGLGPKVSLSAGAGLTFVAFFAMALTFRNVLGYWPLFRPTPALAAQSPPKVTLYLDCHQTQTVTIPENGPAYEMEVVQAIHGPGFLFQDPLPNGKQPELHDLTYKCTLTNYSDQTIFDVLAYFPVRFMEQVTVPTGFTTGKVLFQKDWPAPIPKIDPGSDRPFVFYIWTPDHTAFLEVRPPEKAIFHTQNSDKTLEANVKRSYASEPIVFWIPQPDKPVRGSGNNVRGKIHEP